MNFYRPFSNNYFDIRFKGKAVDDLERLRESSKSLCYSELIQKSIDTYSKLLNLADKSITTDHEGRNCKGRIVIIKPKNFLDKILKRERKAALYIP